MNERVKVLFEYEGGEPNEMEVESMWAIPSQDGFTLDNIPFFVREIALGDTVSAKPDSNGALWFDRLISASGHSTLRLWFAKDKVEQVIGIREKLRTLGCSSELSDLPRLVAVDVPPTVEYSKVKKILDEFERGGLFEYEEACLGGENEQNSASQGL